MSEPISIRLATTDDIAAIKHIAEAHKPMLGFVSRGALTSALNKGYLLVAEVDGEIGGYVEYYIRRDRQLTIYSIAVAPAAQRQGVGRAIIEALVTQARGLQLTFIQLKCPANNPANHFYSALGFVLASVEEPPRGRLLNVWRLLISDC